ncbi:hypothetical protein ACFW1A_00775 [Kitasatospora sp. NPDC058965]|uniref:hypothetical protein n=1 Tax=Kitasatospora sp. NPDC058965 TaxID=3346682 RepID=UPI0036B2E7AE
MTAPIQPPIEPAQPPKRRTLSDALLDRLTEATAPGSFLDHRCQDLIRTLDHGWREGPRWVRLLAPTLIALAAVGAAIALYAAAKEILAGSVGSAWWTATAGTLTGAVHRYLDQHVVGQHLTGASVYQVWQVSGLAAGLLSCALRSAVARLVWTSWVAATLAAVWQASPHGSRTVAVALAAAALAAASLPALRGLTLSLRPQITVCRTVQRIEVAPARRLARPLTVVPPLDGFIEGS